MYVVKRDGRKEAVHFDKITARLKKLSYGLSTEFCDPVLVAQKVCMGVYKGVTTAQLDELAAETAAGMTATHPDYALLAARIAVSNLHKKTKKSFSETVKDMYAHVNQESGLPAPLIADDVYEIIMKHAERLDSEVIYDRDFDYDYFGFKTLERSYLLKVNGKVVERPQHMLMRVAVGIHKEDIEAAVQTYHLMSQRWFTHASPTLFNSGTPRPQLSSCFLVCMKEDSIEGIYDTLKECAVISKSAGGIGLSAHCIRAKGSYIRGTNGMSNGIVPMLRVFNDTARYVDQGGGKRKGAFAIYIEPWHSDVLDFLDLRKNHGKEENRARDLFYGLWIPDLFMQRVQVSERSNMPWSLFCPNEAPGLADCWGEDFEALYLRYEREGRAKRVIPSQKLWFAICEAQIETGNPYMLFKGVPSEAHPSKLTGSLNHDQRFFDFEKLGEIAMFVSCNLNRVIDVNFYPSITHLSLLFPTFFHLPTVLTHSVLPLAPLLACKPQITEVVTRNLNRVIDITEVVTRNLNRVIDVNYYPTESARRSNMRHRPIGLGVQGLADAFILLGMPFDSPQLSKLQEQLNGRKLATTTHCTYHTSSFIRLCPFLTTPSLPSPPSPLHIANDQARQLNRDIFETIYYHALRTSCQLAKEEGTYESYPGCPVSKGVLQPDMWGVTPSDRWDWAALRADIAAHRLRNSPAPC
ncbi:unnamed protein product, partial [Closterium sp. NIES-65]